MTFEEFANKNNLKLEINRIPFRTDSDGWGVDAKHYAYKISVAYGDKYGKSIKGYYSQGSGIKTQPSIGDILNALSIDTNRISDTNFDMWCCDFGYDTDSRKTLSIYKACLKEYQNLLDLLGKKELEVLYSIENL